MPRPVRTRGRWLRPLFEGDLLPGVLWQQLTNSVRPHSLGTQEYGACLSCKDPGPHPTDTATLRQLEEPRVCCIPQDTGHAGATLLFRRLIYESGTKGIIIAEEGFGTVL